MLRLALLTLRGRRGPFAGAFVAAAVASALVMACGTLLATGLGAQAPVERYAAAGVVVAGVQDAAVAAGTDEDHVLLRERARIDARLVARLAALPGVRTAIADSAAPARLFGPRDALGEPEALHPWPTAALGGVMLRAGRPPRADGELVVSSGHNLGIGDR